MKTYTIIQMALLMMLSTFVYSQQTDRGEISKRIQARKIAFMTERLDLSPAEAEKFFPLYNEYKKKEQQLREKRIPKKDLTFISDDQADQMINDIMKSETEILELKKEYTHKLRAVVSPKKILMLFKVEKDFNAHLLRMMRQRKLKRG